MNTLQKTLEPVGFLTLQFSEFDPVFLDYLLYDNPQITETNIGVADENGVKTHRDEEDQPFAVGTYEGIPYRTNYDNEQYAIRFFLQADQARPQHSQQRNHRYEKVGSNGQNVPATSLDADHTACELYCSNCDAWIVSRGIIQTMQCRICSKSFL